MKSNLNSDFGYYNFLINNSTNEFIPAEFSETRIMPVLTEMQDWQVGVNRFKIPATSIPLMVFEEKEDPPNVFTSPYYIGFSLDDEYTNPIVMNVEWDDQFANNDKTCRPCSRFLYYYNAFLQMVNKALRELYTIAYADPVYELILGSFNENVLPYFDLDDVTSYLKIFLPFNNTLEHPSPFVNSGTNSYINIHLSKKLFYFFSGFNSKYLSVPPLPNMDYVLNIASPIVYDNVVTLKKFGTTLPEREMLVFYQDYSSLYLWSTLTRIILTTNIPIEQENIGVKGGSGVNFQQILLTDFEIVPNKDGAQRDYIFYFADTPRYQNFTSNGDLRMMDLRVYFQTRDLETFLLDIPPTFELSVKLQFKRRKAKDQLQYSQLNKFTGSR